MCFLKRQQLFPAQLFPLQGWACVFTAYGSNGTPTLFLQVNHWCRGFPPLNFICETLIRDGNKWSIVLWYRNYFKNHISFPFATGVAARSMLRLQKRLCLRVCAVAKGLVGPPLTPMKLPMLTLVSRFGSWSKIGWSLGSLWPSVPEHDPGKHLGPRKGQAYGHG